jgi:glycosyltransferase involved in cell wall biosynthesis
MNKKEHDVTVLMPAYNAGAYIAAAMESILMQSHTRFELLIIDDGSTDHTPDVIRGFTDSRIRLIRHETNQGLTDTLNEGIAACSTELIARMDTDDISHPWRLEKQVAYMLSHPACAMVDSWVKVMDQNKKYLRTEGVHSGHAYYTLTFECPVYHSAVMFRKSCLQAIGGYKLPYAEDFDLFWRLSRVYPIHTLEEPLLWYRVHDRNLHTAARKTEYDAYTRRVLERNFRYYLGKDAWVPEAWSACYRYDFDALLQSRDLREIRQCLALLDKLSARILVTENPNRDAAAIRYISHYKKSYILKELGTRLPLRQMARMLLYYKQPALAATLFLKRIKGMVSGRSYFAH